MKALHLIAAAVAVTLLGAQASQASIVILAGFHAFDATSTAESADVVETGFSATVAKAGAAYATGGCSDSFYGLDLEGPTINNGHLAASSGAYTVITLTNNSGSDYLLEIMPFDAAAAAAGAFSVVISYQLNDSGSWTRLTTGLLGTTQQTTRTAGASYDYADLYLELGSMPFAAGDTFAVRFSSTSTNLFLDNIAIVGTPVDVPEPSCWMLVMLTLGAGAWQRSRRG